MTTQSNTSPVSMVSGGNELSTIANPVPSTHYFESIAIRIA